MTSAPDTVPAPQPHAKPRRMGNLRSMVISMFVIVVAVLAWVAMVPRVREVSQRSVDVTSVARQVRQETSWAISQPQLPAGWKATNVRFVPSGGGLRTWHAGYLSPDGDYVSIDQTVVAATAAGAKARSEWLSAGTSNGQAKGNLAAAGKTWQKLSARDTVQRSLVSTDAGTNGLVTVLSGTASYAQLAQFAEALEPVPAS